MSTEENKKSRIFTVPERLTKQLSKQESLSEISHKRKMSVIDYAVILASLYGIGAAVGIVTGAAVNIVPDRKRKPNLYTASMLLIAFGAWRGYRTISNFKNLENELLQDSLLEQKLTKALPKDFRKYLYTDIT